MLFGATLPERGQMQHVAGCHDVPLVLGVGDLEAVHGLKKEEKEIWRYGEKEAGRAGGEKKRRAR